MPAVSLYAMPLQMLMDLYYYSARTMKSSIRELKYFCASKEELPVFSLPDWETLPYDSFSPHQDIISERLNALYHLPQLTRGILVLSITSLMHRLPPHSQ